jgi:hypothetical protein
MTSWKPGAATIRELLRGGDLDRVAASASLADRLLQEAETNIASAEMVRPQDPGGAVQLGYDAARKAATSLLVAQGLRPTSSGGHVAVQRAVTAQFGNAFKRFGRMRRRRHAQEYPNVDSPTATDDDALEMIAFAGQAAKRAREVLGSGRLGAWSS